MGMGGGGLPGMDMLGGGGAGGGGGMFSNNGGGLQMSQIPFIGGLFPNPNEAAMRDAMAAAGQAYAQMRPQQAQGYQNIMSQVQNQMAPASEALSNMYGGQHGQNSDVTAAIAAQNAPTSSGAVTGAMAGFGGPKPSDNSGNGSGPLDGLLGGMNPLGGLMGMGGGGPLGSLLGGSGSPLGEGTQKTINSMTGPLGPLGGILGGSSSFGGLGGLGKMFGL